MGHPANKHDNEFSNGETSKDGSAYEDSDETNVSVEIRFQEIYGREYIETDFCYDETIFDHEEISKRSSIGHSIMFMGNQEK